MNARRIAKSVFSTPLLFVKFFKKLKIDNFLGGLLIGALFSLGVNVITVQLQEITAKQKYFEALEREIATHFLQSSTTIESINMIRQKNEDANPYSFTLNYSTSVWESGNATGYFYDLDPEVQAKITFYYPYTIFFANRSLDRIENEMNDISLAYTKCLFIGGSCDNEKRAYDNAPNFFEETQLGAVRMVNKSSFELMEIFHPTQDRLDNFLLRLFMGDEVLEILRRPVNNVE